MNAIDTTTATNFVNVNKGAEVLIDLTDDTQLRGTLVSVNTKGVNFKVDGKTRSVALSRVVGFDFPVDEDTPDVELHDGMTTTELAAVFGIEPKELRVHLRALGLGVGKGRKYSLSPVDYRRVNELINA